MYVYSSKPFTDGLERAEGRGTWTTLTVPFDVEEVFGHRGRVAVRGTIDGQPFRGSLMPHGDGRHFVVVNKALRTAIGKEAGDSVLVELEPDHEPRVLTIPEAFSRALAGREAAKAAFDRLSYSHRKEYVDWIEGAKKPETKERRALKAVEMLLAGTGVKGNLPGK
jgi:hypothetical protein